MPRSNWKGYISFGLVSIPIALFNSKNPASVVSFKQINKKTGDTIKYKRIDSETGREVPWEEIGKGYQYSKDVILPVGEDELKRVAGENARTIAIEKFVDKKNIDLLNVDKTYYLVPDKKGEKGYVILREALNNTNKVAIAKVIISTKEYLAAVATYENALVLYLLHYDEEIRKLSEFDIPSENIKAAKVTPSEISIAEKLIKSMSGKWKPEEYKDEYREAVEKWVEAKVQKEPAETMTPRSHAKKGKVVNFVDLLKQSLKESKYGDTEERTTKNKKSSTTKHIPARHSARKHIAH